MSLEENKALIHRLVDAFNKHNVTLLDEFIAPDARATVLVTVLK